MLLKLKLGIDQDQGRQQQQGNTSTNTARVDPYQSNLLIPEWTPQTGIQLGREQQVRNCS